MRKLLLTTVTASVIGLAGNVAHAAIDTRPELGPDDIAKAIETAKQNELRFKRDYEGRTIFFSWVFYKVSSSFSDGWRVEFGNGSFSGNVYCRVSDQSTLNRVIEWDKGHHATIRGTIVDGSWGDLELKNCSVTDYVAPESK
jgi:hypothetical protein